MPKALISYTARTVRLSTADMAPRLTRTSGATSRRQDRMLPASRRSSPYFQDSWTFNPGALASVWRRCRPVKPRDPITRTSGTAGLLPFHGEESLLDKIAEDVAD